MDFQKSDVKSVDIGYTMYEYFSNIVNVNRNIYFRKANFSRIRAVQAANKWINDHPEYKSYDIYPYEAYEYYDSGSEGYD